MSIELTGGLARITETEEGMRDRNGCDRSLPLTGGLTEEQPFYMDGKKVWRKSQRGKVSVLNGVASEEKKSQRVGGATRKKRGEVLLPPPPPPPPPFGLVAVQPIRPPESLPPTLFTTPVLIPSLSFRSSVHSRVVFFFFLFSFYRLFVSLSVE